MACNICVSQRQKKTCIALLCLSVLHAVYILRFTGRLTTHRVLYLMHMHLINDARVPGRKHTPNEYYVPNSKVCLITRVCDIAKKLLRVALRTVFCIVSLP